MLTYQRGGEQGPWSKGDGQGVEGSEPGRGGGRREGRGGGAGVEGNFENQVGERDT